MYFVYAYMYVYSVPGIVASLLENAHFTAIPACTPIKDQLSILWLCNFFSYRRPDLNADHVPTELTPHTHFRVIVVTFYCT